MSDYSALPREGIYVSKTHPEISISVVEVIVIEDEDDEQHDELFYLIYWIAGEDESDLSSTEYEFAPAEWQELVNALQLEFDRDPYLENIPEDSILAKIRDSLVQGKNNDCT